MENGFITKIHINHVRNIKDTDIELSSDEAKHLILTGPNGSGKTSLLAALRLYLTYVMEHDAKLLELGSDPIKNQFDSAYFDNVATNTDVNDMFEPPTNEEIQNRAANASGVRAELSNMDSCFDKYQKGQFIVAYYQAEREYAVRNKDEAKKMTLQDTYSVRESPGHDFVEYMKNLILQENMYRFNPSKKNTAQADSLQQRITLITQALRNIYANESLELDFDVDGMSLRIKEPDKEAYAFDELASGYAAVLYIVLDLMMRMEKKITNAYDLPGIVMVDEVDAHLHLSMQRNVLKNLTELFPNIQFIVTTHSPFVLNSVDDAVIYDLGNNLRLDGKDGLANLPYSGIVEGYFGADEISAQLKAKFERYKVLAQKEDLTDDDYVELGDLETTLDSIPDFLATGIMANYRQIKLELWAREEGKA